MPTINQRRFVPEVLADEKEHRRRLAIDTNASMKHDGTRPMSAPFLLKSYTVSTLPTASLWTGGMIYVSDETGGATLAFSDGSSWRRAQDRAVVS